MSSRYPSYRGLLRARVPSPEVTCRKGLCRDPRIADEVHDHDVREYVVLRHPEVQATGAVEDQLRAHGVVLDVDAQQELSGGTVDDIARATGQALAGGLSGARVAVTVGSGSRRHLIFFDAAGRRC